MLAGLVSRFHQAKVLMNDHSTTILTGVGVGGTVATAFLTGRASFKAAELIDAETHKQEEDLEFPETKVTLSTKTKVKLVWRLYLPAFGVGATTITSIIAANKISSKKIAALAVASGISERALQEYKTKVVEKLGMRQDRALRDEIAQDRVSSNPASREVILAGTGEVLFYDMTTGRYFQSTMEEVKRAENKINYELIHSMSASLSEFYDLVGLAPTNFSDTVGWNTNNHIEVLFSTVLSTDGRPCIAIDFSKPPISNYEKLWN